MILFYLVYLLISFYYYYLFFFSYFCFILFYFYFIFFFPFIKFFFGHLGLKNQTRGNFILCFLFFFIIIYFPFLIFFIFILGVRPDSDQEQTKATNPSRCSTQSEDRGRGNERKEKTRIQQCGNKNVTKNK